MKILFAAPENAWGGFIHILRPMLPGHHFAITGGFEIKSLKGIDILIPTMSKVTNSLLSKADRLRLIQQCGAGLEGVDIEAAKKNGIWVANVPSDASKNADSVAELGIYMAIGLLRDAHEMSKSLKSKRMGEPLGKSLYGRTVGLVGLGGIGKALIRRLRGFGVKIIGIKQNNPEIARKQLNIDWVGGKDDLETLLKESDLVFLCLPLKKDTESLLNETSFRYMKSGAYLINLSRGGLIDRRSLEIALASGKVAGAGLDVFWEEPPDPYDSIFSYNVIATPHVGAVTDTGMTLIAEGVAENVRKIEKGEIPFNHV